MYYFGHFRGDAGVVGVAGFGGDFHQVVVRQGGNVTKVVGFEGV